MKDHDKRIVLTVLLVIVFFVVAYRFLIPTPVLTVAEARRSACKSNLGILYSALTAYCEQSTSNYPASLSLLNADAVLISTFFCPGKRSRSEDIRVVPFVTVKDVDKFTDYIYVANIGPSAPTNMPVIICPPENHAGDEKGGCVLFPSCAIRWVPSPEIDAIISNVYSNTNLTIVVSEALTKRTGGKYRSRP